MKEHPLRAKRETKKLDFKSAFDTDRSGDWCEFIKDFVAMANSGGGTILVGVADNGKCTGSSASSKILQIDPATLTDKVAKYTGVQFDAFTIDAVRRSGQRVAVITIGWADPPMVFEKPGTYVLENGKDQKNAFSVGTLYVRHGAKSAPALSADIARMMAHNVQRARKEWLSSVRKVTSAPRGSTVSFLAPHVTYSSDLTATPIRVTTDPTAPEYHLIDPDKTHPWRQKELIQELNRSLPAKINSFDLLAVRRVHHVDEDANFVHKPRFGSTQYSPNFAKWLLEQHSADPSFFEKCRSAVKTVGTVHAINDERLQWLADLMQEDDLRISQMARRIRISQATLSRLLAGKYKGDVSRMLERIEAYRREVEKTNIERSNVVRL